MQSNFAVKSHIAPGQHFRPPVVPFLHAYMNGTVTRIQYAKYESRHLREPGHFGR